MAVQDHWAKRFHRTALNTQGWLPIHASML
ncbi:hypothetical protein V12B01_12715 [Vibrio splendidus 12B01]|nr:hypothetical protein V12B01_12715 [Vibrio splendidus 12B01]